MRSMKLRATRVWDAHHSWVHEQLKKSFARCDARGIVFISSFDARARFVLVGALSLSIGVTLSTFLTWNSLQFIFSVVLSSVMSVREYGGHLLNAQHSIAKHTIDIVQPHPQLFLFSQFLDECRGFMDNPTPTVPDDISVSTEVVLDIDAELSDSNALVSVISKTTDFFVEDVGTFFRYISNIMLHTVKTFLRRQKLIYTSLPALSSFDIRFHTLHNERGATFQTQSTCAAIHSFQHPLDNFLHPPIYPLNPPSQNGTSKWNGITLRVFQKGEALKFWSRRCSRKTIVSLSWRDVSRFWKMRCEAYRTVLPNLSGSPITHAKISRTKARTCSWCSVYGNESFFFCF